MRLSRRVFLGGCLAAAASAQKAEISAFDLSLLDDWITPTELFFVREHFAQPNVSAAGWKLPVGGAVAAPFEILYDDLLRLPRKSLPVTVECAENPVGGGLVSHAEWAGVSLSVLLERAQPAPDARFVRLVGADGYTRSIPLAKARHADTLVAHGMNGQRLPENHGFPLRAVVPGWYGMDAVKWLQRIEVLPAEDNGVYMTRYYRRQVRSLLAGVRATDPVTAMKVKSVFSRPVDGAILVGRRFIIRGAAWAGEKRVRSVEVSTDGGKSWAAASLSPAPLPYAWVQWSYDWRIPAAGNHELIVRASDDAGQTQRAERASDRADDYEHDSSQTVRVTVT